ncbi:taste receptor type 2 member 40-like [Tiliqua scincoides]|uniref:taste receptor type 2 member 40-like n=1 Tax=Tiliqua scincoides TaxID=71010 RepID=UPI003461B6ED
MPESRPNLHNPFNIFYLTTAGILYLLVIITNGLIVVVNLADWTKVRSLMPKDEIVTSLGLSNICFSTAITLDYFTSLIWKEFYRHFYCMQIVMFSLDIATSFSSFWFMAWLTVFYCMKIVDFKQPFLLKVKLRFSGLIRWLLLGSVLVSVGATLLVTWAVRTASHVKLHMELTNQTDDLSSDFNLTLNIKKDKITLVHMALSYRLLLIILGCSAPLVVVIFSSIPVLKSLFTHAQNLGQNLSLFHNPRLEVHLNAAKAVLSLLLSYCSSYICEILIRAELFPNWTYQYFLCLTAMLVTIVVQGSVLILSNPKLKQSAAQVLPFLSQ